ncbi:MAG: alpha/beta fold hydrolase, partial [Thermoanaerobaculia bacterium]
RRDVDFLYSEVKRVNPDYRDEPLPAEMTRRYEELKKNVPKLSDEEIFVGMSRMLAPLHQGHVVLWTSPPLNRYLPVRLYAFPDGIYVIEGRGEHKDLAGSRVLAFGSVPAEEMLRRLADASSADGDMQYLWGVSFLAETSWLKGLGSIGGRASTEWVTLTVQKPGEASRTVTLATSATQPENRQDKLVAPPGVAPPLFLRDPDQMHWELALPEHDALYVQINNLVDDEDETLPEFGRRLWTVIEKGRPKNLIVDLRHNNGGNTLIYPELLRTLIAFSREPGNQVYALIGRRSYSATGNFVTDLERLADPIFAGEASSECCNLYGDATVVMLPYSKVEGELTNVKWNLSTPSDRRREMSPEVPVQLTAKAYFAGEDPAMEAVQRMIATRKKKLALSPCNTAGFPSDALCGTYEVFENRAARTGRMIPLRVMVVPANVPNKEPDAITFFAGGPGESAVDSGGWLTDLIRAQGPQTRDLLLVDLRGTGKSAPLHCLSLAGPQSVQGFLDDFMPAEDVRSCREQLSRTADLTRYTSEIAVDDVDEVRAALGYEKLNVVGGSYGTRTAQVYMRRHPSRVRTATLFVTLPNDARTPLDFARSAQNALDGAIAECAGDAACRAAFPRLKEEIDQVLRQTEKEPVRVQVIDPGTGEPFELRLNRDGLAQTLRYMLYNTDRVAQLPLFVHLAAGGDFTPLAETARAWGDYAWSDGYFLAITCAEDVPFIREEEIPAAVAGTFLGDFRIRRQQAACKAWSAAKLGPEFLAPTVSDAPTLLLSGERDPVTPPRYAEAVLRHLRNGVHVVIPDGAHGLGGMKGSNDCEWRMMVKLIEAGTTEGFDSSCVSRMERPAFALRMAPEVTLAAADLERLAGTYRESKGGFEARLEVFGGNKLRARYSDGLADLFVPISPARFRTASDGYNLVFRVEAGRAAALTMEQAGQPVGGEMLRVP